MVNLSIMKQNADDSIMWLMCLECVAI